ncbi:MAG: KAP family NTPase, partial [Clostridia bacterium]|nr:KAP family NTPase [Clostridia bacterium]
MTKTYTSDNAGTGNIDNDLTKAMNKSENINIQYVKNYLRTQSYGALMVTGNWGCGKTHFFKNELRAALKATDEKKKSCPLRKRCFRKKEYDNGYTLVMVSLFGLHDLHNLPELIFYEFLNAKTDKKILGSLSKKLKDLLKALPTKYVDLTSLAGEGKGLYYIMKNSKVVICLDDLERVDRDKISLREILGVVNNLIENFGFKVIVIANEEHLLDSKNQDEKDFMEKAIEKTVAFVPDTVKAFKEIARIIADKHDSTNVNEAKQESYESSKSNFIKFISRPEIIRTIDPNSEHALMYPDYKK